MHPGDSWKESVQSSPTEPLLQGGGRNLGARGAHNIPFGEWLVSIHG